MKIEIHHSCGARVRLDLSDAFRKPICPRCGTHIHLSTWQKIRARLNGARPLTNSFAQAVSPVNDVWGSPSANSEFQESLEKLARRAWTQKSQGNSTNFLFKPEILLIRDEEVLNEALVALYSHARMWAGGLEIPYRAPRIRISRGSQNAGQFECDEEGWLTIELAAEYFDVPKAFWVILAHEICHHILELSGLAERHDSKRNERLTDTAMFVCGFGGLVKSGQTFIRNGGSSYIKTHLGYLKSAEYAYAYHWAIATRCANGMAGMSCETASYPRLAAGCTLADDPSDRLKVIVPDPVVRKRLFDRYQHKYPSETCKQTYDRIIDSIERDRL